MKKLTCIIIFMMILYAVSCEKNSTEPENKINTKFFVTYIQNTPSSAVEFITTYAKYDTILLEWEPITHHNIEAADYRLEYWFYTDAGLVSHKNGHFQVAKNCTLDVLNDLDDLKEGNEGFLK